MTENKGFGYYTELVCSEIERIVGGEDRERKNIHFDHLYQHFVSILTENRFLLIAEFVSIVRFSTLLSHTHTHTYFHFGL